MRRAVSVGILAACIFTQAFFFRTWFLAYSKPQVENGTRTQQNKLNGSFAAVRPTTRRHPAWIFYNGIPKSGTSSLRESIIKGSCFTVQDLSGPMWGCKPSVADLWREQYAAAPKNVSVFATGHACWVNFSRFSEKPIAINTVREPTSRWRSAFNYGLYGRRPEEKKRQAQHHVAKLLDMDDSNSSLPTFDDCVENDKCLAAIVLNEANHERQAFTPCELCDELMFKPNPSANAHDNLLGITPTRASLLATIDLMLHEYSVLIPLDAMATGLEMLERTWPDVFVNLSGLESHARAANSPLKQTRVHPNAERLVSFADRSGFRLTYEVACARFCHEAYRLGLEADFCKTFVDSSGMNYLNGIDATQARYLLWKTPMQGGLHNQLMAFLALGKLAAKLNRTLVVPQFLFDFPGSHKNLHVEFEDTFNLTTLLARRFPSQLVEMSQIPAGLFVSHEATVSVDDKDLQPPVSTSKFAAIEGKLKEFNEVGLLTVQSETSQLMSESLLVSSYGSFTLNNRLSQAFDDCVHFVMGEVGKDSSVKVDWGSIVFLHLRIESDWLKYSRAQTKKLGRDFEEYYTSLAQIKAKFHASVDILNGTSPNSGRTIVLSYAAGKLPNGTSSIDLQTGWPEGFRIVTSDQLQAVVGQYSYLQRSALLSQVAFKSGVFVGNKFSSFSKVIVQARSQKVPSYVYNTRDEMIVPME